MHLYARQAGNFWGVLCCALKSSPDSVATSHLCEVNFSLSVAAARPVSRFNARSRACAALQWAELRHSNAVCRLPSDSVASQPERAQSPIAASGVWCRRCAMNWNANVRTAVRWGPERGEMMHRTGMSSLHQLNGARAATRFGVGSEGCFCYRSPQKE